LKQLAINEKKQSYFYAHEDWVKIVNYARDRGTPVISALENILYPMAQKMIEPLGLYYPIQISFYAAWLFENFGEETISTLKKDLNTRMTKPFNVDDRISARDDTRERVAKRRKVSAKKNPLKMQIPELLEHLKKFTGVIQDHEIYRINYNKDLEKLTDEELDKQIQIDVKIYCRSQQLVLWNAYCIGHSLEVAKQRAIAKKMKWESYLNLVCGVVISKSYADKHINFFSLCKKYPAFHHVAAPISWVIDRVDAIRNYLLDHLEEASYWESEPGEFVILGESNVDE